MLNEHNICRNFDERTNKCRIYKSRPLFCNIDEMYEQKYFRQMSRKEFYLANLNVCCELNSMYQNKNNIKRLKKIIAKIENQQSI